MNLHEFQAKTVLSAYGIQCPNGRVAVTADEAEAVARDAATDRIFVKAQILAGARAPAGGVRDVGSPSEARAAAQALLGQRIVTEQTGAAGHVVHRVLAPSPMAHCRAFTGPIRRAPSVRFSTSAGVTSYEQTKRAARTVRLARGDSVLLGGPRARLHVPTFFYPARRALNAFFRTTVSFPQGRARIAGSSVTRILPSFRLCDRLHADAFRHGFPAQLLCEQAIVVDERHGRLRFTAFARCTPRANPAGPSAPASSWA